MNTKVKRIAALLGAALLVALYLLTLIFALLDNPNWFSWFQASIFCTVAVPVFIYAMQLIYKLLKKEKE